MSARFSLLFPLVVAACNRGPGVAPPQQPPPPLDHPIGVDEDDQRVGLAYPVAERIDHVDVYHGVTVPDPYRWLEDPDADKTRAWIEAENRVTFAYLDNIEAREQLRERLTKYWNYERYRVPERHGSRYVVSKNDGLQNQSVLYTLSSPSDKKLKVLLDPNKLSKDGTVALAGQAFTHDGERMAYGVSKSGSDWEQWRVRDVASGIDHPDKIDWVKFSEASWSADGAGFYYAGYDEPKGGAELEALNYNQKVYYHKLGTEQSTDELVYARPDHKEWGFDPKVTEDGRYLVVTVRIGTDPKTNVFYQDLRRKKRKMVELLPGFKARYQFVGNNGPVFWIRTDDKAPLGRMIAVDTRKPERQRWAELIGESKTDTLRAVEVAGDRFVASYLHKARSKLSVFKLDGKHERDLKLPGLGTVRTVKGKRKHGEVFYSFTGVATPTTILRYDTATGSSDVFREPELAFDPADYTTKQVFYTSKDKTEIPMFISHRKDVKPDGQTPTYLYGYGGFNIPLTPSFSVPDLVWMEMGGIYAVPNLRGGGEFGKAWHQAGTKLVKQNVFDDFIAAAEYLVAEGYTKKEKLAIGGRSNGGLLVGAVMTQRPELFAAALPGVGVMDMLRFNKFTIGWAWQSDYGSPQKPKEFEALFAYSPYHNLKEGTEYPPTMIYTADHDDRVVPAHSFKFAAALQHAHAGAAPVLIRIDTKSGHGAGKPTSKKIEEWVDLWGFLVETLGIAV